MLRENTITQDSQRLTREQRHVISRLAMAGVLAAPMIGLSLLLSKLGYIKNTGRIDGFLSTIYMVGFLCVAIGLRLARVTGRGNSGTIVSGIQIIGLLLALDWAVLTALGNPSSSIVISAVTDMAWPFSHLFMLVVGTAAWRAKVWLGWPVVMLFVCGSALPLAMAGRALVGDWASILFAAFTATPLIVVAQRLRRTGS